MADAPARTLGSILVEARLVTDAGLREAQRTALRRHVHLIEVLVDEHMVDEDRVTAALVTTLGLARATLSDVDEEAVRELPHDLAAAHLVLPLRVDGDHPRTLTLAMVDPLDEGALRDVTESTGCRVVVQVASVTEVRIALPRFYRSMITRMIPRLGAEGRVENPTQPHLELPDERSVDLRLRALVELLVERGIMTAAELEERVRTLAHGEDV